MIKRLFAKIRGKKKVEQTDVQKAAERLKALFITDPYIPLENLDDINLLCRYVQESVPISDIKAMLVGMDVQRRIYADHARAMRAMGLNDAMKIIEEYPGMLEKLEGLYGLSENN